MHPATTLPSGKVFQVEEIGWSPKVERTKTIEQHPCPFRTSNPDVSNNLVNCSQMTAVSNALFIRVLHSQGFISTFRLHQFNLILHHLKTDDAVGQ
jgi:hypothetical protein